METDRPINKLPPLRVPRRWRPAVMPGRPRKTRFSAQVLTEVVEMRGIAEDRGTRRRRRVGDTNENLSWTRDTIFYMFRGRRVPYPGGRGGGRQAAGDRRAVNASPQGGRSRVRRRRRGNHYPH
ncbi:hypothetical protein E2C01_081153 [Portunus trituberculatus]|uniref:Uncharacterized protein n=1 Tax=Portunus trituberculatus TaxID=210409 RepID=A0A5B7IP25_PORTR|nr:hypothetical protein [Portunus trituberculatus]